MTEMHHSDAYMMGWRDGVEGRERDERRVPEKSLAAYSEGFEAGDNDRVAARQNAKWFDTLDEVNMKAFAMWNLGGQHPELPDPPPASGCHFKYCWMPVDTKNDNHRCRAHGGKDAEIPKKRKS